MDVQNDNTDRKMNGQMDKKMLLLRKDGRADIHRKIWIDRQMDK